MSNSNKKSRKTRSDKFPLTLHKTGQYCKKIKGKIYYFGSDRKIALQRYLGQASEFHLGKSTQNNSVKEYITIEDLSNLYLEHQDSRVQSGEITADHYRDQLKTLRNMVRFLGQNSMIYEICTLDLQDFKKKLVKKFKSAHRINLNISIMKAMFHWAKKNEVVEKIPNIINVPKFGGRLKKA